MIFAERHARGLARVRARRADGSLNWGTGFIVAADQNFIYLLTCYHIIADEDEKTATADIRVQIGDRELPAQLVEAREREDLVLLKINRQDLRGQRVKRLKLASGSAATTGEGVLGMGFLRESGGLVTGRGTVLHVGPDYIETDVFTEPGFSGSPLFNRRGEVIGIIAGYRRRAAGEEGGTSFAIPSGFAQGLLDPIRARRSLRWMVRHPGALVAVLGAGLRYLLYTAGVLFLASLIIILLANPFVDKRLVQIAPQFTFAYVTPYEANAELEPEILSSDEEPACRPARSCARLHFYYSVEKYSGDPGEGGWILILWDKFYTNFLKNLHLDRVFHIGRDFSRYSILRLAVKGRSGGEVFGVGIKDTLGNEDKVLIAPQAPPACWSGRTFVYRVPPDDYGELRLELAEYFPHVVFTNVENVSFFVIGCSVPRSRPGICSQTVYITGIRFESP